MLRFMCLVSVILAVRSASAPMIKQCLEDDSACIQASAQAALPAIAPGVPELGIQPLDPLKLALIRGDQGGLQLSFKDTVITGMKNCVVEGVKREALNWREVMQEVAPPIVRAIVEAVVNAVEALYKAVPAEKLYIQ